MLGWKDKEQWKKEKIPVQIQGLNKNCANPVSNDNKRNAMEAS